MAMAKRKFTAGFTLIELMIVVAVVGILVGIAVPAYSESLRKARRGQVKADLVEYAQMAERWHTINNTYATFGLPATISPREGGTTYYNLAFPAPTATTFTITATATGPQTADRCGDLSINSVGAKTNSSGTLQECW